MEDSDLLEIGNLTNYFSLSDQEKAADELVKQIIEKSDLILHKELLKKAEFTKSLPEHLQQFKLEYEKIEKLKTIKLPLITQLTPRSRKRLNLMPPPDEIEKKKLQSIESYAKNIESGTIYKQLNKKTVLQAESFDQDIGKFYENFDNKKKQKTQILSLPENKATVQVVNRSTEFFEYVEFSKERKQNQADLMSELFDKKNNNRESKSATSADSVSGNISLSGKQSVNGKGEIIKLSPLIQRSSISSEMIINSNNNKISSTTSSIINNNNSIKNIKKEIMSEKDINTAVKKVNNNIVDNYLKVKREYSLLGKDDKESEMDYLNNFSNKLYKEMGLNINKDFNKHKLLEKSVKLTLLNFYKMRLRSGLDQWIHQVGRINEVRRNKAATIINRGLSNALNYKNASEKRRLLQLQFEKEMLRHKDRQFMLNTKSITISTLIRRYIIRKKKKMKHARIVIAKFFQARFRGYIARQVYKIIYSKHNLCIQSATTIQSAVRRRIAKRMVRVIRKLVFVQNVISHIRDSRNIIKGNIRLNGAELYIAKAFRAFQMRKKLNNLIYWNRFSQALLIQRCFRGYQARKLYKIKVLNFQKRKAQELVSSIIIQKEIRAYLARQLYYSKLQIQQNRKDEKYESKLVILQQSKSISFNRMITNSLKKLTPFRYIKLNKKAIVIQRIWRGHHSRKRCFFIKMRRLLKILNTHIKTRNNHVIVIQKMWRGSKLRLDNKRRMQQSKALIIQCLIRIFLSKCRLIRKRKIHLAAKKITKYLFRSHKRKQFLKKYRFHLSVLKYLIRIQSAWRAYLARKYFHRNKNILRTRLETKHYLSQRLSNLLSRVQLKLIKDTITRNIGSKYSPIVSKVDCPCLGPVQAIFVQGACSKGRDDIASLMTNKLDSISLIKFCNKIIGLTAEGRPDGDISMPPPKPKLSNKKNVSTFKRDNKKDNKNINKKDQIIDKPFISLALLDEIETNRLIIPPSKNKVSPTDLDILFNKSKIDPSAGNLISYSEFVNLLKNIATTHYHFSKTIKDSEKAENNYSNEDIILDDSPPITTTKDNNVTVSKELNKKKLLNLDKLVCSTNQFLSKPSPDNRLLLIVKVLISFRYDSFMQAIFEWLQLESLCRVGYFVTRIQNMYRCRKARIRKEELSVKMKAKRLLESNIKLIIKIQACGRMYLSKSRVSLLAQKTIIRYIPPVGVPYWQNPKTKITSLVKPKVLRNFDSYSVSLPEHGLENLIHCCYCPRLAEVNCMDCEDSMCRICFDSLHCKGQRRMHQKYKIPSCSFCKYQVATKSCTTCILQKTKEGTIQSTIQKTLRGMYCDTCFTHEHDHHEHVLQNKHSKKKGIRTILNHSKEAYLIRHHIHQKIKTNHNYDDLIQNCEECTWRSASWRCIDCRQVYCNKCLVGLHSIGGPFSRHKAEVLPYYTPEMHRSFQKDFASIIQQAKMDKINKITKSKLEEKQYLSAVYIQSWWRMILGARIGKKYMQRRRRAMRSVYRLRKRETLQTRNTTIYKLKNVLGYAPRLNSDTREEAALRKISVIGRERARTYIWKNIDDMNFNQLKGTNKRKGVPRSGFNIGTIKSLSSQAKRGGYRLPGYIEVTKGQTFFKTSSNLSEYTKVGDVVRIEHRLFKIVDVQSDFISVDRKWMTKGLQSLVYKVPSKRNEEYWWHYRLRHQMYSIGYGNVLSQLYFKTYKSTMLRMIPYAKQYAISNLQKNSYEDAEYWKKKIVVWTASANWANGYIKNASTVEEVSDLERFRFDQDGIGSQESIGKSLSVDSSLEEISTVDKNKKKSTKESKRNATSKKGSKITPSNESVGDDASLVDSVGSQDDMSSITTHDVASLSLQTNKKDKSKDSKSTKKKDESLKIAKKLTAKEKRELEKKKLAGSRPPGVTWFASDEENLARRKREEGMSKEDLAAEADEWKEVLDPMTDNIFYQNILTFEMMTNVPRAVAAKRQIEFDNSKNKKNYDEAQKRISKFELVTKNRLLITGGRKK